MYTSISSMSFFDHISECNGITITSANILNERTIVLITMLHLFCYFLLYMVFGFPIFVKFVYTYQFVYDE